jgi:predicted RNase H-like HicB family nuclease
MIGKGSKMLYPIYVHKQSGSAYAGVFPDVPGCFAAADDLQHLTLAAQEAFEAHFGTDADPIPTASTPDTWMNHPDYQSGGFWMLVEIDTNRVRPKAIRLNISLPETLVKRIDAMARRRKQSRSAFLAQAAEREMADAWKTTSN